MKRQLLSTIIFLLSLLAPCVVDVQMNTFSVEACVVSEAEREIWQDEETTKVETVHEARGRLIKKIKVESVEEKREVDSKEEDPINQSKFRTHIFYAREAGGIPNIRWLS
jgi:hypothetical protein